MPQTQQEISLTKEEVVDILRNADVWQIQVRNFNPARLLKIWVENPRKNVYWQTDSITTSELFEDLRVNLAELSQIFVEEPWEYYTVPKEKRTQQPIAADYESLGCIRAWDSEGWKKLAKLLNKNLMITYTDGEYNILGKATFYPNGLASGTDSIKPPVFAFFNENYVKTMLKKLFGLDPPLVQ